MGVSDHGKYTPTVEPVMIQVTCGYPVGAQCLDPSLFWGGAISRPFVGKNQGEQIVWRNLGWDKKAAKNAGILSA